MSTPRKRKQTKPPSSHSVRGTKLRVAVITGTRAEFGLLVPVMDAIRTRNDLHLLVVAAGAHFLPPARTIREVQSRYPIAARVPMQRHGKSGRAADALALGRGVQGFARAFARLKPDWVVVLGDRIEAFAAASAASIAGIAVCHIHGGDRAEGIADEAMRHAITKLSHLHCAATKLSAERIQKMGEDPEHVHITGSPSLDGLENIPPCSEADLGELSTVRTVVLLHPSGLAADQESKLVQTLIAAIDESAAGDILALAPNHDPGHEIILQALHVRAQTPNDCLQHWAEDDGSSRLVVLSSASEESAGHLGDRRWFFRQHLPREHFIGLLKYITSTNVGLLAGNSSAGLIEAASIGVNVLNVGPRQNGRERAGWIEEMPDSNFESGVEAITALLNRAGDREVLGELVHGEISPSPYGDGRAGPRIAALLARTNPRDPALLRKRNSY